MFHISTAVSPTPRRLRIWWATGPLTTTMTALRTSKDYRGDGDSQSDRQGLPDRAALTDAVDDVGEAQQGRDAPGCRPQGHPDTEMALRPAPPLLAWARSHQRGHEVRVEAGRDGLAWSATWVGVRGAADASGCRREPSAGSSAMVRSGRWGRGAVARMARFVVFLRASPLAFSRATGPGVRDRTHCLGSSVLMLPGRGSCRC